MTISYRPGCAEDGFAVTATIADAVNDLHARHDFGISPRVVDRAHPFFAFACANAPDGFWVADDNGQVIGLSLSLVHGPFWYLSYLFIQPSYQSRGVGRQLIERALQTAADPEIAGRGLVTFAYNPASISLYLRYGMYPREPIYQVAGPSSKVIERLGGESNEMDLQRVSLDENALSQLSQVDEQVLGFPRHTVHRYLLANAEATCYFLQRQNELLGYAYVSTNGGVGPLAVLRAGDLGPAMRLALRAAAGLGVEQVSAMVPGSNEQAMSIALEAQLRIRAPMLFMASVPFTSTASYLFHSPGLM